VLLLEQLQIGVALLDGCGRVLRVDAPVHGIVTLGGTLVLPRLERGRSIELLLTSITASEAHAFGDPRAVLALFIREVDDRGVSTVERLQRRYGFTATEARVAVALASGASLSEIARSLGMSRATARNHLKQILSKTDTHRQAQLVALLLRGELRSGSVSD
jgi:DNA-binding CsgD family transcriptional regulator